MASPPLLADGTPYSAGLVRRLLGGLAGKQIGRFEDGDFAFTLSGSTVTIAPGRASIPAAATEVGTYLVESLSATVLTLDPADNTRDRFDALVAYVVPPATPEQVGKWYLAIRKGEPAASPAVPNTDNTYHLGTFRIPSAATGLPPSVDDDLRDRISQVVIVGPTQAGYLWPEGAKTGQIWTDWDERRTYVYDGVDWVLINQGIRGYWSPSDVYKPRTDDIIYDRSTDILKRYNGSTFEELDVQKPRGKRWRTAAFQQMNDQGVTVTMQGSRVQGGMTSSTNGLVLPRDGIYRLSLHGYATGISGWRAGFNLTRARSGVSPRGIIVLSYWKQDAQDYMGFAMDDVPLKAGDEITMGGSGAGHTWGVDEMGGARFTVEYVRSLPPGVNPV